MNSDICTYPLPELLSAEFITRPNRFLVRCRLNKNIVEAHLPDPGRLQELLLSGAELMIEHTPSEHRKTQYTVHLVRSGNIRVCINTGLPNRLVLESLRKGCLPGMDGYTLVRPEVKAGRHRFDFELRNPSGHRALMEVKSVSLVESDGTAKFPDAVTERGRSHAALLTEYQRKGTETIIYFVVQRSDALRMSPHWERDPAFANALLLAEKAGVRIKACRIHITENEIRWDGCIPVRIGVDQ